MLAEFRGHSPAERDKLRRRSATRSWCRRAPGSASLVVTLQHGEEAVRRRARAPRALAGDRPLAAAPRRCRRSRSCAQVGGVLRPATTWPPAKRSCADIPASARTSTQVARRGEEAARGSRRPEPQVQAHEPQCADALHAGRRVPDRPVAADRREGRARAARDASLSDGAAADGNLRRRRSTSTATSWTSPTCSCIKYISADKSPINYGRYQTASSTSCTTSRSASSTPKKRNAILREFERHALDEAYTVPTIWWHRIIVHGRQLKGWEMTPSHYVEPGSRRRLARQ